MAVKSPVVTARNGRKPPGNQRARRPAAAPEVMKAENGASPKGTAAFDPQLFLTKLDKGKSSREYQEKQVIFSQGDAADAVFYIHSGKVKLTVVSKPGKEAVVAILPESSFFGEGCLAGQPIRMSTASTVQRS